METRHFWEENRHPTKYENYNSNDDFGRTGGEQLNFAVPSEDEGEYPPAGDYPAGFLKKGKVNRQDPMSHRIIEKRRRDRMNNCLADLSRLIPPEYLKKGRGRVEKTEIIEMAIKHLKYLQDRVNGLYTENAGRPGYAAERQASEEFRAGFQEAVAEAVRFLVDVHGYGQADGICAQLASHLQRHCELDSKADPMRRDKGHSQPGSSSETGSSSSSLHGYAPKGVITRRPPDPPEFYPPTYEPKPEGPYQMDCDRVSVVQSQASGEPLAEPLPLDTRHKRDATLRTVRKPEHTDDYLHSYKFKNSIERRFSMSQDCQVRKKEVKAAAETEQAADMSTRGKFAHKRRRAGGKHGPPGTHGSLGSPAASTCMSTCTSTSASASASGSNEDGRDNSPQDTSTSDSSGHHHFDKPSPTQFVPVFALNAIGKYYVPLSVEYACVARQLRGCGAGAPQPLHPVTIHVNFQPCLNYHVKQEPDPPDWRG